MPLHFRTRRRWWRCRLICVLWNGNKKSRVSLIMLHCPAPLLTPFPLTCPLTWTPILCIWAVVRPAWIDCFRNSSIVCRMSRISLSWKTQSKQRLVHLLVPKWDQMLRIYLLFRRCCQWLQPLGHVGQALLEGRHNVSLWRKPSSISQESIMIGLFKWTHASNVISQKKNKSLECIGEVH